MADLRIAFIGAGGIAQRHFKTLAALLGEKPISCVCDPERARAAAACAAYGGSPYEDMTAMMKGESPDVVFICSPQYTREEAVKTCCRKNLPFFCEKPPAHDLKVAARVAEVVSGSGVLNAVGFMYRHSEIVEEFKKTFEGAAITNISSQMACGVLGHSSLPGWYKLTDKSGGPIMDQGIHLLDLTRYLAGEIVEVQAFGSNQSVPKSEAMSVPDSAVISYRLASGAVGMHYHSWAHQIWTCQMEVRTSDSRVQLEFARGMRLFGSVKGQPKDFVSQKDCYVAEVECFLQAVREKNPSLIRSTYHDAVKSMAVAAAASRSLETGKVEKVKEV